MIRLLIVLSALLSRTPSVFGTTTQRVLVIPELLELVFSFLNAQDNARNARVCKAWTQVALDLLWREVDHLPRLLSLLAPTEDCTEGRVSFTFESPVLRICTTRI